MARKTREPWIVVDKLSVLNLADMEAMAADEATINALTATDADISTLSVDGDIDTVDRIQFNLVPPVSAVSEGQLIWDEDAGTVSIGMPGGVVVLQTGQENLIRCKAGEDITNGQAVTATGASGSNPIVGLADNTSFVSAQVLGIATEDISNGQLGYINTFGLVRDIDTSTLDVGVVWLGTAGGLTKTRPEAGTATLQVVVGICLRKHAEEGVILVTTVFVPRMQYLSDVYAPSVAEGNVLAYDATAARWEVIPGVSFDTTTGHLTLSGDATVWDDLRIATSSTRAAASAPDFVKLLDNGSGSAGVFAHHFDKTTEEQLFFALQMPHAWNEGSTIYPHVHWVTTGTHTGTVVWGLEYSASSIDGTFGNTTIITGSDAGTGTTHDHILTYIGSGIDMTGLTHSCMLQCRIFRKASDGSDTYDEDAALLEIDFHYEINQLGDNAQPGA